jgi:transcriptional regulator with XRE-family HTH domain
VFYPDTPVKRICPECGNTVLSKWVQDGCMAKRHPTRPHLRSWRLHLGKTTLDLANIIGTSHSTVLRWEAGENGVQQETFDAIAKAYGITPAELSAPPAEAERARLLHRLMSILPQIDDRRLQRLTDLAEDLSGDK